MQATRERLLGHIGYCFFTFAALLGIVSCGGGIVDKVVTTPVSGFVSKGPITGATCSVFNAANQLVLTASTVNGAVSFGNLTAAGAYTASCVGGTYLDEATGQTVSNTTVLHSGIVIGGSGAAAVMNVTPLTELAYQQAGGDATRIEASAQAVAQAFGLPASVNLLTTTPTDVNTTPAANDGPGSYGTVLAAIAQMQKDQGATLTNLLTTLGSSIDTSGSRATMNAAVASQLSGAAANLTDPTKNNNPAVQGFVAAATSTVQSNVSASADTKPFVNSIDLNAGIGNAITAPVFGQSYQLVATGGNLGAASFVTTNMSCGTPAISGSSMSATCVMAALGSQASVSIQSGGVAVQGLMPSVQWYLGSATQSCQSGAVVNSISPTTFAYGAQGVAVTVQGCSLNVGATLNIDGQLCAVTAGGTSSQLQFSCNVTNSRVGSNAGTMILASFGASASRNVPIAYTVPAVAVTSANPTSIVQGANGSSNWTVNGNGLFTGMTVSLGGTTCTSGGTANAIGTQLTGVDCSNVQVSQSSTSATLAAGSGTLAITLTTPPVPVINVGGTSALQVGGAIQLAPSSASSAPFTYSIQSGASSASVSGTGFVSGLGVGSASVLVSQAAVIGQFAATSAVFNITVSARTVPSLSFASSAFNVTLGDADFNKTATVSCATGGTGYAPPISYTITSGGNVVNLSGSSVALKGAGSATIQASVPAVGTCAAQTASYTLTVGQATPVVTFASPVTSTTYGQAGPTNAVTVSVPVNNGTGGALPSTSNLAVTYSSGSPGVATIDVHGNISVVGAGTTVIGATSAADSNYQAGSASSFTFTVLKATPSVTIATPAGLNLRTTNLAPTGNVATVAGVVGGAAPTGAITYSSANTSVANVDSAGNVTPVGAGSTTITATYVTDANYATASASYPVQVVAGPAEGGGPSADGMSFVYTGLPGGDLTALQAFDFNNGAKTLYWQPNLASGGIPDASNPGTDVFLTNFGYDDRIIIKVSSGAIPEPETGGTYPPVPDPYGTYPAGTTFPVSAAGIVATPVVYQFPQNPQRGYDYERWQQRYYTGLGGTPGGLNNLYNQYPYDQYTYYNDRAVPGTTWGKFEVKAGYLLPTVINNGDGTTTTIYNPTVNTITLSGFPTYYNPWVDFGSYIYSFTYSITNYNSTPYVPGSAADAALVAAGCPSQYISAPGGGFPAGFYYFCPSGNDGVRPQYTLQGNVVSFRP